MFLGKTIYSQTPFPRPGFYAGVSLQWISIPIQGQIEILVVTKCFGNWDNPWPDGTLGLNANIFCSEWQTINTVVKFYKPGYLQMDAWSYLFI